MSCELRVTSGELQLRDFNILCYYYNMEIRKKKKSFFEKIFFSQVFFAFIGLGIIALVSLPLARNISQRHKINKEVEKMQEEIDKIEGKNNNLKKLVTYLESDQFIEEQARLKLGLKKNGEEVVAIKNEEKVVQGEESDTPNTIYNMPGLEKTKPEKFLTNPKRWWSFFLEAAKSR